MHHRLLRCPLRTGRRKTIVATLILFIALSLATVAGAQPVDEERGKELAGEAMGLYKDGDFDAALDKFKEARAIYPTGQVLRLTAYTLIAMERWLDAANLIDEALATEFKPLLPRDAEHAQDQLAKVLQHIGRVEVTSSVADARVTVDGGEAKKLPAKINVEPGKHTFVVTAPDHLDAESERDIEAGQDISIELDPKVATADAPPPKPKTKAKPKPVEDDEPTDVFGWFPHQGVIGLATAGVGVGFGVAALATGIYGTNLRGAVQENIDAHNQNYDPGCSQNADLCRNDIALINRDGERAQDFQTTGLALGITGAALFTVGTVLFLFSDDSPLGGDDGADKVSLSCLPQLSLDGSSALACGGRF